ncbi:hypothetical protein QO034_08625 [Sedimentitalea sp. JM2-8]|uniref:Uncharacterized protein n=1 Tax=Sedimentitalea xiamensis TaxID=3050037 RepID=A0ABT7FDN4_9RHOB|nr:hypothetical protein [Sedimentitalea xiamensis]MDK3073170.1 hypothetical protein [Sedimentitalea xiamensis]
MSEQKLAQLNIAQIQRRVQREFLSARIMDNNLRGYWCEAMLAEALGDQCAICSFGWAPWDLQIGKSEDTFPSRIRIQVKNSAARQTWHSESDAPSDCLFNLTYRKRPHYFERDNPGIPCETFGFMCDLFALCHHSEIDELLSNLVFGWSSRGGLILC